MAANAPLPRHRVLFVSGIGTDVGKSYATGHLARMLMLQGLRVATVKFIQTGCPDGGSIDIDLHRRIMGCGPLPEDAMGLTAPAVYSYPASPHLAARLDGRRIPLGAIGEAVDTMASRYDTVLVEGAGGLMVPLSDTMLTIDWPAQRGLPLVLVTNGQLGAINHTVLSLEAIEARGLRLPLVMYDSWFDSADPLIAADNLDWIRAYLKRRHPGTRLITF